MCYGYIWEGDRMSSTGTLSATLSLVIVVAVSTTLLVAAPVADEPEPADPREELVSPGGDNQSQLWPYTSRSESFDERTIDINVVFIGDAELVRYHLTQRSDARWNETEDEWSDVDYDATGTTVNATDVTVNTTEATLNVTDRDWGHAHGSSRYVYVDEHVHGGDGRWIGESYQLHDGEYFGARHHLRVYEATHADDEWVAIQGHREHWDWFRLRHTVDSTDRSQTYIEREFMDEWFVADVWRKHFGNHGPSDADGWATVIELQNISVPPETIEVHEVGSESSGNEIPVTVNPLYPLVAGVVLASATSARGLLTRIREETSTIEAIDLRPLTLLSAIVSLYLFVRLGGVFVERAGVVDHPYIITAVFYPLIALGIPLAAVRFSRGLSPVQAFTVAAGGTLAAFLIDYSYLGVTALPITIMFHRLGVAIAVGLIAAGSASWPEPTDGQHLRIGILLWMVALVVPLVRIA